MPLDGKKGEESRVTLLLSGFPRRLITAGNLCSTFANAPPPSASTRGHNGYIKEANWGTGHAAP